PARLPRGLAVPGRRGVRRRRLDGQALRDRSSQSRGLPGRGDARRLRLHARAPRRAFLPRRAPVAHRLGHVGDDARDHRAPAPAVILHVNHTAPHGRPAAPVALAEIAVDLRQAEPGRFREELARALATLGPEAADDDDRVWVDDWAPMRESIIWRFNRLFWQRL